MNPYGASIERGIVREASENGYRVESLTRFGLITPTIPAIHDDEYSVGDHVYFFLFGDGHGAILASFNWEGSGA